MTIISTFTVDHSAALAKRFASLAAGYLDNPESARQQSAQVALENIFRLLEMFRYDSFADESRRGVLALESLDTSLDTTLGDAPWHTTIERALNQSLTKVYGSGIAKEEAIDQLQACLRSVARGENVQGDASTRAKGFLTELGASV